MLLNENWWFGMVISDSGLPSLKLTARTWKWMVGILLSYWDGLFSGATLYSFREAISKEQSEKLRIPNHRLVFNHQIKLWVENNS